MSALPAPWGPRCTSIHQRAFAKYYSGHLSAHYRGVLISPVTVTKQHHLSTGKTGRLILHLNKWRRFRHVASERVRTIGSGKKSPDRKRGPVGGMVAAVTFQPNTKAQVQVTAQGKGGVQGKPSVVVGESIIINAYLKSCFNDIFNVSAQSRNNKLSQ